MPWSMYLINRLYLGVLCWLFSIGGLRPVSTATLNFTHEPRSSVFAQRNHEFTIDCSASGVPEPTMSWRKDDAEFAPTKNVQVTQRGLRFVRGVQVGTFRCVARNSAGVLMSKKIAVDIIYLRNISVTLHPPVVGHIARLECKVLFNQPVNITWFRDNQSINVTLDTRITLLPSGVMQIRDFRSSDNGKYSCRAENKYEGVTSSPLQVVQQTSSGSRLSIYPGKAVNITVGHHLVIECVQSGPRLSNLIWRRFSRTQTASPVLASGASFANLVFDRVRVSDAGEYVCEGEGAREKVIVSVQVPPSFPKSLPRSITLVKGNKLTLECAPQGNPTPHLTWFRNGRRLVESSRVRFVRMRTVHRLVIGNTTSADNGVYQCEAENELGSCIEHTILNVTGNIGPPTDVRAYPLSATAVNVTWNPPSAYSGQSVHYSVHYSSIEQKEIQAIPKKRATYHTIKFLNAYREYEIYVKVYYSIELKRSSDIVTVRTLEKEPSGPPLFVQLRSYKHGTLDITWLPPNFGDRNGKVTEYYIMYYAKTDRKMHNMTVVKNFYSAALENLVEDEDYFVKIAAKTKIGMGPYSKELSYFVPRKSTVGVILPAPTISAKLVNSSIVVSVKQPVGPNVKGYQMTYRSLRDKDASDTRVDITERTFTYMLHNLKVNSEYAINVTAQGTGATLARPAIAVVATKTEWPNPDNKTMPTLSTAILPPMGLTCHPAHDSTVLVLKWRRSQFRTAVTEYRIKYSLINGKTQPKFIVTKNHNITLIDQMPGSVYDVEIQSILHEGSNSFFSPPGRPESGRCFLLEKKPDTPPSSITCEVESLSSIIVTWRKPTRPNGKITEYQIHWRDSMNKTRRNKFLTFGSHSFYSKTLQNVRKDLKYVVYVYAVNSAGISPSGECSLDTRAIITVSTTETSNGGSNDTSSLKYDDIKLGIIIGCIISLLFVIFLAMFVLWSDPCGCRRHKPLRDMDVETSLGTDNQPKNRVSKPDTNSTEISDGSSKHSQISQKYLEEASKESDRGLGMTPKNSQLCLDNEKIPFLEKTQPHDYSTGASFDSQDSGIQGLDKLEKGSSSSSSSIKDAAKMLLPQSSKCDVVETVC